MLITAEETIVGLQFPATSPNNASRITGKGAGKITWSAVHHYTETYVP